MAKTSSSWSIEQKCDHALRSREVHSLPAAQHQEAQQILTCLEAYDAGDDDAVRRLIQPIGPSSPFAAWKLFFRGLLAFNAHDDERARENWRRISPQRLPYELAAPLRLRIDPEFAVNATQKQIQQSAKLTGVSWLSELAALLPKLDHENTFAKALKNLGDLLPEMKKANAALLTALQRYTYLQILRVGSQSDITKHRKLFDAPIDDPEYDKLNALGYERVQIHNAIVHWERYANWLAKAKLPYEAAVVKQACSLIYCRLAELALNSESPSSNFEEIVKQIFDNPEFTGFKFSSNDPKRAELFYSKAFEFDPGSVEAALWLIESRLQAQEPAKALALAERHLAVRPDSHRVMRALAKWHHEQQQFPQALEWCKKSLSLNPLDSTLRKQISEYYQRLLREPTVLDDHERAIQLLAEAKANLSERHKLLYHSFGYLAHLYFKDQATAETHRQGLLQSKDASLAAPLAVMIDASLLKPKPAIRKGCSVAFTAELAGNCSCDSLIAAWKIIVMYTKLALPIKIPATYQRKLQDKLIALIRTESNVNEETLYHFGRYLVHHRQFVALEKIAEQLMNRFPRSARMALLRLEAIRGRPKSRQLPGAKRAYWYSVYHVVFDAKDKNPEDAQLKRRFSDLIHLPTITDYSLYADAED